LFLQQDSWKDISNFFDEKWFISVDIDIAMERVRKRHLGTGLSNDQAILRINENDKPNGILVNESMKCVSIDKIIESKDY
jgi:pantothenate kinase